MLPGWMMLAAAAPKTVTAGITASYFATARRHGNRKYPRRNKVRYQDLQLSNSIEMACATARSDDLAEVMASAMAMRRRRMTLGMYRDILFVRGTMPCSTHFGQMTALDLRLCCGRFKEWINDFFELAHIGLKCIRIGICDVFVTKKYSAPEGAWVLTLQAVNSGTHLELGDKVISEASSRLKEVSSVSKGRNGTVIMCLTTSHEMCL